MKTKTTLAEFRSMNSVRKKRILRKNAWCWVFMLPTLILYILFQGYPIITSAWYSLLDWSGMTMNATFVGLGNFKELLQDPLFFNSVGNSFKYMLLSVPIQLVLSLVIAYILTSIIKKGATVFRTMYFIPVVTTASIVGIIMIFIFGGTGPVNQVLSMMGIDTINFLGDAKTAMFTVVLIGVWKDLGTYMIYWIAALQSVPQDVYEAAKIDGCGTMQIFFYIIGPMSKPTLIVSALLNFIWAWKDVWYSNIYLGRPERQTISVRLLSLIGDKSVEYGQMMAATVMMMLPVILLYFCAQKYFDEGITITELK